MADRNLKVVPASESKTAAGSTPPIADTKPIPQAKAAPGMKAKPDDQSSKTADAPQGRFAGFRGKQLRKTLLIGIPAVLAVVGVIFYLLGGRYVTTDNAYVGAQKVLITPDVSGKVAHVAVREGQHVNAGDELFTLDRQPYEFALVQAQAKLSSATTDFKNLKTNIVSLDRLADLAQANVDLKQKDVERKTRLLASQAGSQSDVDTAAAALVSAELQSQFTKQQRDNSLNQLLGDRALPLEKFPSYTQAKAAAEQAQRDLDHTELKAPIAGIATQVDNIQLGRYVMAGSPILSVIDDAHPWVDANPKETDITYLRPNQPVEIEVDTFPDHTFRGVVQSISPGTGSQFSILPAQNASGNWVKVVQRVPVRIIFEKDGNTHLLRTGMSTSVSIDTGHSRIPFMSKDTTVKPAQGNATAPTGGSPAQ